MYDFGALSKIHNDIGNVRMLIESKMSDTERRLAVATLREIATELDCLKPVDATEGEMIRVEKNPHIPTAPGPDYATQKQLDALTDRMERIEKMLSPKCSDDCRSGVAMSAAIDQGRRIELYNQAYLAALPRVVGQWGVDGAAGATGIIATQSMEYLK